MQVILSDKLKIYIDQVNDETTIVFYQGFAGSACDYRRRIQRIEFKFWLKLFAFHIVLIRLEGMNSINLTPAMDKH